jgi:hypothetical protein
VRSKVTRETRRWRMRKKEVKRNCAGDRGKRGMRRGGERR